MKKILLAAVLFAVVSCTKEKTYLYDVNNVNVTQATGNKGTSKTTTEFISIAYSDLFGTTISNTDLVEMFTAYSSFGDKKLVEDRIIRVLLDRPGVQVPTNQTMRNDVPLFVTNSYKKFFNRAPNEFEKYYLKNMIQNDTNITPEMLYHSFMTSNEYRYY
jgi:hypothetical protein